MGALDEWWLREQQRKEYRVRQLTGIQPRIDKLAEIAEETKTGDNVSEGENQFSQSKSDTLIEWWLREQQKKENRDRQLAEAQARIDKLADVTERTILSDYIREDENRISQEKYETLSEWWNKKRPEEKDSYENSIRQILIESNVRDGESRASQGPYQTIAEWSYSRTPEEIETYNNSIKKMLYGDKIRDEGSRVSHGTYQTIAEWSYSRPSEEKHAYENSIKEMHSAQSNSYNHQSTIIWILILLFCLFVVYVIFSRPSF